MVKIMIVEDHRSFREVLKECLRDEVFTAVFEEAGTGGEALEKVGLFRPDLILMDIHLPDMSGLELTKTIKEKYPTTIVAILSSYDSAEFQKVATRYGAKLFLSKSETTRRDLLALVKSALSR